MAYTPYSRVTYTSDGTDTSFAITFPYLYEATLQVYRGGFRQTQGVDYTIDRDARRVVFTEALPLGMELYLKRVTPRRTEDRPVIFTNGSGLDDVLLNTAELYLLFVIQEILDDVQAGVNVGGTGVGTGGEGVTEDYVQTQLSALFDEIQEAHDANLTALNAAIQQLNTEIAEALASQSAVALERVTTELSPGGAIATKLDILAAQVATETAQRMAAVASESSARVTADESVAQQLAYLVSALGNANSAIATEAQARASADSASALTLSSITSRLDDPETGLAKAHSRITEEASTRTTELAAQSSTIQTLTGRVGTAETAITNEQAARATADEALAGRATALESSVGGLNDSLAASDSRIANIEGTYATKGYAEARKSEAISAAVSTAAQDATDKDNAVKTELTPLIQAATASIEAETVARANADTALARTISRMASTMVDQAAGVEKASATLEEVNTTLTTATTALASRMTAAEASINALGPSGGNLTDAMARIASLEEASADTNAALAQVSTNLTAEAAAAASDATAKANAAESNAKQYTDTKAVTLNASVATEAATRASATEALARTLSRLTATQGDAHASVQILADALIDATGKIIARWNLQLQAGDIITGIEALAQNGANPVSKIKILANIFEIVSSVGGASVTPFEVVEGVTKIKKAMIGDGDIDTLKIAGNSVIVPVVSRTYGPWWGPGDHTINTVRFYLPQPAAALVQSKHSIYYPNGARAHTASLQVDDEEIDCGNGIGTHTYVPLMGVKTLGAGWHTAKVIAGIDNASYVDGSTIAAFAAMR